LHALAVFFGAAGLTVAIETPLLALLGYRTRRFILVCVLVNLASNLTLNLGLSFIGRWMWPAVIAAEIAVVIVEWAVLRLVADKGDPVPLRSKQAARLLAAVFAANLTSFLVGVIFWH